MTEKTTETPPMIEEKSPTKIQTHQEEHKEESEWHQKAKIFNHLLRLFCYLEPDQFGSKSQFRLMPYLSTGPKMLYASSQFFGPDQKLNCI
jgi:hypothetical protein